MANIKLAISVVLNQTYIRIKQLNTTNRGEEIYITRVYYMLRVSCMTVYIGRQKYSSHLSNIQTQLAKTEIRQLIN